MIKNLPVMHKTWVQSLCEEDPQEKGMATHSSILAWRIPWTEEPGGLQSMGSQGVRHNWANNTFTFTIFPLLVQALGWKWWKMQNLGASNLECGLPTWLSGRDSTYQPRSHRMWVQSQGWEDPLGEEMATLSSILTWKIPWTEEPVGLQSIGLQRVGHNWAYTQLRVSWQVHVWLAEGWGSLKAKVTGAQSCPTLWDPWTAQSMEFSRPEYWSG